jgi:hypothetical protein
VTSISKAAAAITKAPFSRLTFFIITRILPAMSCRRVTQSRASVPTPRLPLPLPSSPATLVASSLSSAAPAPGHPAPTPGSNSAGSADPVPERRRVKCRRVDKFPRLSSDGRGTLKCSTNVDGSHDFRSECEVCTATKSRTCRPSSKTGQGRPFGMLWSWLVDFPCTGDRAAHAAFTPTYAQRRAARLSARRDAIPVHDWSLDDFLGTERPRADDFDDDIGEPRLLP